MENNYQPLKSRIDRQDIGECINNNCSERIFIPASMDKDKMEADKLPKECGRCSIERLRAADLAKLKSGSEDKKPEPDPESDEDYKKKAAGEN